MSIGGHPSAMTSHDPVVILQDLIRFQSVAPREAGALSYLQTILSNARFECHRLTFEGPGADRVDNLFARIGSEGPHLCFAGHSDVVPALDEKLWSHPPYAGIIADGRVHGRGATDMKGSIAAFIAAVLDQLGRGSLTTGSLSLLITGDEEGPAINGTAKVLRWMEQNGHLPQHCLVGEPTCVERLGDTIKIGRRGSINFAVTVEGKSTHVAYPEKGDNPVPKLASFVDRISKLSLDNGNSNFDPSALAVTSFDVGNPTVNVIPSRASAKFNIRFNTEHSGDSLKAVVAEQVERVKAEMGGQWTVDATGSAQAFISEVGSFTRLVGGAIKDVTGLRPRLSTSGGTSDARFISRYCPFVEFGPTNTTIHQIDESIEIKELIMTKKVYSRILERYFEQRSVGDCKPESA